MFIINFIIQFAIHTTNNNNNNNNKAKVTKQFATNSFAISVRSIQSVHSLCACNNIEWLRLGWVSVDRRNVFKRQCGSEVNSLKVC